MSLRTRPGLRAAILAPRKTWNPADARNLLFSNGNKTVTNDVFNTYGVARSTVSASSGKKYWEMFISAFSVAAVTEGIANRDATLTSYLGTDTAGMGWGGDGAIYGGAGGAIQTWADGDTLCFALDIDNGNIWFRTNGGNWNNSATANPATNTEGKAISPVTAPFYAATSLYRDDDYAILNLGATPFAQAVPAGFGKW